MRFRCSECGLTFSERDAITIQSDVECPECGCRLELLLFLIVELGLLQQIGYA